MGTLLGLGPERKWRGFDCSLVRDHASRALGRIHSPERTDDDGNLRKHRHQFLMVWGQHAWRRSAFVRIHAKSFSVVTRFHDQSMGVDQDREPAVGKLAEFLRRKQIRRSRIAGRSDCYLRLLM